MRVYQYTSNNFKHVQCTFSRIGMNLNSPSDPNVLIFQIFPLCVRYIVLKYLFMIFKVYIFYLNYFNTWKINDKYFNKYVPGSVLEFRNEYQSIFSSINTLFVFVRCIRFICSDAFNQRYVANSKFYLNACLFYSEYNRKTLRLIYKNIKKYKQEI